jgi:hypothetical protein
MYGRAGDLLKLNRDRNNPELSMFQRKQADEAHAKIVRQLKNKPLMRMRLRLINATRAGDLEEAAKIQIGMRALMKEDQGDRTMKILCVHSALNENQNTRSAVDMWRIYRPMRELAKHVDWQIDHQSTFIKGIEKYKNAKEFTEDEMQKAFETICQYDIVFSSYHADPTAYSLLKVAADKAGCSSSWTLMMICSL